MTPLVCPVDTGTVKIPVKNAVSQDQKMRLVINLTQTTTYLQGQLSLLDMRITCQQPAARLAQFVANWSIITQDQWVLQAKQGYHLDISYHIPYTSKGTNTNPTPCRSGSLGQARDTKAFRKRGDMPENPKRGRIILTIFSCPPKRWRSKDSTQS